MVSSPRPVLRLIPGGLASDRPAPAALVFQPKSPSAAEREESKLCAAILKLGVAKLGLTVEQALDELSEKCVLDDDESWDRCEKIVDGLRQMGLRFMLADASMELTRLGYTVLTWPDRLVARHPEIKALRPEAHPYMLVG